MFSPCRRLQFLELALIIIRCTSLTREKRNRPLTANEEGAPPPHPFYAAVAFLEVSPENKFSVLRVVPGSPRLLDLLDSVFHADLKDKKDTLPGNTLCSMGGTPHRSEG